MNILQNLLEGNNNPQSIEGWTFESYTHQRYENKIPVMGLQEGHGRIIKVEKNISGEKGYSVTILNVIPNPFTGDKSMATKPMIIVSREVDKVVLQGYGNDRLSGLPFSNYGLSIYLKEAVPYKVILHMHERGIDIEYLQ